LAENRMTSKPSPPGRRILIAVVTGEAGRRIQTWREKYDPEQARRLPPHATLCYWAPTVEAELLERQVRHAFEAEGTPTVRLGQVRKGDNDQETLYVEVIDTAPLNAMHFRLCDGTFLPLPGRDDWLWHVTCVRESRGKDQVALMQAAQSLDLSDAPWTVETVAYMELRGDRYEPVTTWQMEKQIAGHWLG
jgi:2'-5' RNA ligase superfamily